MTQFRYLFADLVLDSEVPLEGLPLTEGDADLVYSGHGRERPILGGAVARHQDAGLEWLRVHDSAGGFVLEFLSPGRVWFSVSSDGVVSSFPESGVAESTTRHLLLAQVLPLLLASRGATVLHASAVTVPPHGPAVLFVGPSGSGKSSTAVACFLAGADLLCDDFTVLRCRSGSHQVVPANHGVRLWPDVASRLGRQHDAVADHTPKRRLQVQIHRSLARRAVNVGLLALLGSRQHGDAVEISVAPPADAVIEVIDQTFRLKPADIDGHISSLEAASALVSSTPVVCVRLPNDLERLEFVGAELLDALRPFLFGTVPREVGQAR